MPAASLPRPSAGDEGSAFAPTDAARSARGSAESSRRHREHHVTKDYSHVHKDLITVLGVGIVVLAFIFGMSFLV